MKVPPLDRRIVHRAPTVAWVALAAVSAGLGDMTTALVGGMAALTQEKQRRAYERRRQLQESVLYELSSNTVFAAGLALGLLDDGQLTGCKSVLNKLHAVARTYVAKVNGEPTEW